MNTDNEPSATDKSVSQAEVYDNLKRIGELEDEKRKIQEEIWNRTEQLRGVVPHIDRESILFKILDSALSDSALQGSNSIGRRKTSTKAANVSAKSLKKTRRK